jgi:sulfite exporter TauE/SafE
MSESLYYLFLSGIILGAGPCVGFCGPILTGFIAAYKPSLKQALVSYLFFSLGKTFSYVLLGAICGIFSGVLKSGIFVNYFRAINLGFGALILLIGVLTFISREPLSSKHCLFFSRGNLRNAGLLGFLAGFSPCLPLLGILEYILVIAHSPWEGALYTFVFALATAISPVILLAGLSGKLAGVFSSRPIAGSAVRIISSLILIALGGRIILQQRFF